MWWLAVLGIGFILFGLLLALLGAAGAIFWLAAQPPKAPATAAAA